MYDLDRLLLLVFCSIAAAAPVSAESVHKPKPAAPRENGDAILRHTMRDEMNTGSVGIISEGTDYTIDLALTLASRQIGLRVLPIAGAGALQNAKDVIFTRGIDFGVVQTDVLDELKRNPPFRGVERYLKYITKLYNQELHILAGPDVQSIHDLTGKPVNFGPRGGGTDTTATAVLRALGVEPQVTSLPHPVALDKLRRGELTALAYVTTKPSRLLQDVRPEDNLHFLPVAGNLAETYLVTTITADDYPDLVSKSAPVNTVAVATVLVAYDWPTKSARYQRAARFVQALFAHLDEIKARRPKWGEFEISASVPGWTRFSSAEQWLEKAEIIPKTDSTTVPKRVPLDRKALNALFRELAQYHSPTGDRR
jgi:TRAP-type uncharacterized transport system substrate-binding protein